MKYIDGNILNIESGIICHVVNHEGVMGAGLARQIAQKWPHVEKEYREYTRTLNRDGVVVQQTEGGDVLGTEVRHGLYVANLYAMKPLSAPGRRLIYTDLAIALVKLSVYSLSSLFPVYFPHGMGCGLAGGDWATVVTMIAERFPDATICKLKE